jgi:phage tail-like protein
MADGIPPTQVSSYLKYLPALFQESDQHATPFIGRFLLAFEKILSGLGDPEQPGLEEILDHIHIYFDPGPVQPGQSPDESERAPADFLPWLASWVALSLRQDWDEEEKRRFIGRIVPLYRQRGTKAGLVEILRTYTGMGVEIQEFIQPLQVGKTSTISVDTVIGGGPPHYFRVKIFLELRSPEALSRKEQIARAIINQEKPAHTYYDLQIEIPTMQIGVHSTVGVDTLLGTQTG